MDELGARERRYVEAYLELESSSSAAPAGARERVLAAALAELEPESEEVEPIVSSRTSRTGVLLAAGVGLCAAAAALVWWVGRASLVEEQALRVDDQAPHVMHGDRAVHEAAASGRRTVDPGRSTASHEASSIASEPAMEDPAAASMPATQAASADPGSARPSSHRRAEPEPGATRRRSLSDSEEPTPTLSDAEVALLERARRLARQGDHAAALAVLREHAESYPRSVLGPERAAEQVAALCRLGAASAESARASFMAGDPPQYLRSRVEKACAPE